MSKQQHPKEYKKTIAKDGTERYNVSRPHSSPTLLEIAKQYENIPPTIQQIKIEAARKAREDVLQEIIRIAKTGECIHPEDGYCDGDRDCTECIAEHLRSTTPQSEQEQPK